METATRRSGAPSVRSMAITSDAWARIAPASLGVVRTEATAAVRAASSVSIARSSSSR